MSPHARQLYLLLVLAADRRGSSFYGIKRCQQILGLSGSELRQARLELIQMDLLASDGQTYQILSLPKTEPTNATRAVSSGDSGVESQAARQTSDELDVAAPSQQRAAIPEETRKILCRIFGRDAF